MSFLHHYWLLIQIIFLLVVTIKLCSPKCSIDAFIGCFIFAHFSTVLLFGLLCYTFYLRRLRSFQQNILPANFCAGCWGFPSTLYSWRYPILLSGCQPCPNWTVSWGIRSILEGLFDGSMSPTFSDKNYFLLQAAYW